MPTPEAAAGQANEDRGSVDGVDGLRALSDWCMEQMGDLEAARSNWNTHNQEIAERLLPHRAHFTTGTSGVGYKTRGEKQTSKIYEARPAQALSRYVSIMDSMLTPQAQRWHGLRSPDEDLHDDQEVKEGLDTIAKYLFRVRYRYQSGFAYSVAEAYEENGAFGTGILYLGQDDFGLPYYRAIPLSEAYLAADDYGRIDTLFRVYPMYARNIAKKYPAAVGRFPPALKEAIEKQPRKEFNIVHAVFPRADRDIGKLDKQNMEVAEVVLFKDDGTVLDVSGYREFPYAISRFATSSGETYGRGPAAILLPDVKMVNEMAKENIVATHQRNRPPLLAFRRNAMARFSMVPGKLNYGALDKEGRALVKPLETGADPNAGDAAIDRRMSTIDEGFFVSIMRVLSEHPNMTATQAMIIAQERGFEIGPRISRQQSEAHGPMITREIAILQRNAYISREMIPEQIAEREGEYDIHYTAPINKLQEQGQDGVAISRTLEMVGSMAEADPGVLDHYDMDEVARMIPEINGAPAKILRTIDEVEAKREARAQEMAQQQQMAAAPGLAAAAKDGAQAADIAGVDLAGMTQNGLLPEDAGEGQDGGAFGA